MIEREPLWMRARAFIDRCRGQAHTLIVGHVSPAFAFTSHELGVEAPSNYGVKDQVIVTIYAVARWYFDKVTTS